MVKSSTRGVQVEEIIELFAKRKQMKDPNLTDAAARAQVWLEHPKLVLAWRLANNK